MKTDERRTTNEGCLDTRAAIKTKIKGQIKSGPHTQVNPLGKAYFCLGLCMPLALTPLSMPWSCSGVCGGHEEARASLQRAFRNWLGTEYLSKNLHEALDSHSLLRLL
eukprot:scaffold182304_cov28-Tisochrysis_lutea.AAC.1